MKSILAFVLIFASAQSFAGGKPHYYCFEDNGTDLSIKVDLMAKTATLTGTNVNVIYPLAGAADSIPVRYVYGNPMDCAIQFVALGDGHTGTASFRCNVKRPPRLPNLDMECTYQRK